MCGPPSWSAVLLAAALAPPATAQEPRLALHFNAIVAVGDLQVSARDSLTVLGRQVPVGAAYSLDPAPGFDVGLQAGIVGPLALRASVSRVVRKGAGRLTAQLPALPFGLPSRIDAILPDGRVAETAGHLDAVLVARLGRAGLSAFGGITFFDLEARLLDRVELSVPGAGPIPVFGAPSLRVADSPRGWNAGIGLDVTVLRAVALGVQLRFARATAVLEPPNADPIELDAGGLHAGLGLRLRF